MIPRYETQKMKQIWSDANRFKIWLKVELAVAQAQSEQNIIPEKDFKILKEKSKVQKNRILKIEEETKHDVIAFLTNVAENVGKSARFLHYGMTSSDLLDTALALQMVVASDVILAEVESLIETLTKLAKKYRHQLMMGRTHGIHAEPITLGLKFLLWREEMVRNRRRFKAAIKTISVGQCSGAVGTYAHIPRSVEARMCEILHLTPVSVSTQIIQRDRHAEWMSALALIGSSLDKFATEIRHLQKTEVLELEEGFSKGQKGSSAMPHKKNPIHCERISGMARLMRSNAHVALENIPLWHERDISHSSVERIILPDSANLAEYTLAMTTKILENLTVYPENMRKNLDLTNGLYYSQSVLLALVRAGLTREKSYELVQKCAMECWETKKDFQKIVLSDTAISQYLCGVEIEEIFDEKALLKRIDEIFESNES